LPDGTPPSTTTGSVVVSSTFKSLGAGSFSQV